MDAQPTKELIKSFVLGRLVKNNDHLDIGYEDNLIMAGIIDSLGIIQLIDYLEKQFSVKVKDEDMVPENFETIECIDNYIHRLQ